MVWYGMVGVSGGFRGVTPGKLSKHDPSFLQSEAFCGHFDEILKGYFLKNRQQVITAVSTQY